MRNENPDRLFDEKGTLYYSYVQTYMKVSFTSDVMFENTDRLFDENTFHSEEHADVVDC